ncbi:hypothetical protein SADUNF_Sadunf14G0072500 [Salix dunnii]|uniref:Uncharacterized protein n=1 Tax=Salix dunnii TaxID=1413687 RepID=A0A835MTK2_9ROSI|nr:hypothetical protein SADUNF_Sadunf14G0072500 [Salix dunnii]
MTASSASFTRFIPSVKARFDYGATIFFILTFTLVSVSGYREDKVILILHTKGRIAGYFTGSSDDDSCKETEGYRCAPNSKEAEDSVTGALLQSCAYIIGTLNGCLNLEIQLNPEYGTPI